ncbi:MAG: sulfur carrier protein ThiS [Bacteroidota bacterium]
MEVFLNNSSIPLPENRSLIALLQQADLSEKKGIAVAVNNQVVPRLQWGETELKEADSITVIKATQGG